MVSLKNETIVRKVKPSVGVLVAHKGYQIVSLLFADFYHIFHGYIFAGWYENGKPINVLSAEYSFIVPSNRALEAKFIPNNLLITDIELFGNLQLAKL